MATTKKINVAERFAASTPARVSSFVEVANPDFSWYEIEAAHAEQGFTVLPTHQAKRKSKGVRPSQVAALVSPSHDTEEGRLIRIHELLHARFTPGVQGASDAARKAGLSKSTINYAEDHRIFEKGKALGVFERLNATMDAKAASSYINGLANQPVPHLGLTTGKLVQAAIALSGYPSKDYNPLDVTNIASLCNARLVGIGDSAHGKQDFKKAQAIVNSFIEARAEVFARKRSGKNTDAAVFCELARLIEVKIVEAYASEVTKKEEPKPAGPEDADPSVTSGDKSPEQAPAPAKSDDKSDQDAPQAPAGEGDGGAEGEPGPFDGIGEKLSDYIPVVTKAHPLFPEIKTEESSDPSKALAARDAEKHKERKALDIEEKRLNGVHLIDEEKEVISPPTSSTDVGNDELVLSLRRSEWAPMTIQLAPLTRSKKNLSPRKGRAGIDGSVPKHLSRWFSDREIMESKGRRPGGALLIDVSGSMDWSAAKTRQLVDEVPALTVALYSSGHHDLNKGLLTIIARNGRIVQESYQYRGAVVKNLETDQWVRIPGLAEHGTGNVCDGPALLWLARQTGPRIWWCDGNVSGRGDRFTLPLTIEAFRLAYLAQVTRTTDYLTVLGILRGKVKPNPVSAAAYQAIESAVDHEKAKHVLATATVRREA